jgi:hypothetical protein
MQSSSSRAVAPGVLTPTWSGVHRSSDASRDYAMRDPLALVHVYNPGERGGSTITCWSDFIATWRMPATGHPPQTLSECEQLGQQCVRDWRKLVAAAGRYFSEAARRDHMRDSFLSVKEAISGRE